MLITVPAGSQSESLLRGRKMRLSKRCEYGIRAAVHLAQRSGQGYTQSREVAEVESLPAKFLESILLTLRSAGILNSKVGAGGGYRLAKPAEEIKLLEIVTLLDPPDSPASAPSPADSTGEPSRSAPGALKRTGAADLGATPPMTIVNTRLDEALLQALGELDLATLAGLSAPYGGQNPQFESRVTCC